MSTLWRGLRTFGGILSRRPPSERREVLDDEGNVICVVVGRPLTAVQEKRVDAVTRPSDVPTVGVPSWLE